MTLLTRSRGRNRSFGAFTPSSLFLGGIQGAWYDPSDNATMFQDAAGLTPVTAVEQPVGSILDKRALAYSDDFGGSGSFYAANSASFAIGTSDFTWEAWIYSTDWTPVFRPIFAIYADTSPGGLWIGKLGANFVVRAAGVADQLQYGTMPTINTWVHVAVVRSGTTLSMFFNGTRVATTTNSYSFAQGAMSVGADTPPPGAAYYQGRISNLRLVKGTAVYDPTNATLTVPTSPLTAVAGTLALTCGASWVGNPSWTNNGATVSGLNPFTASPVGNHAYQSTAASRPVLRARYNLLTYSEDFGNAAVWDSNRFTLTTNATTAPDGTVTADLLVPTTVTTYHQLIYAMTSAVSGATYVASYYVKPNGYTKVTIVENQITSNYVTYDLSGAGTVVSTSGATGTVTALANGWYRITHTSNAGGAAFRPDLMVLPNSYVSGTPIFTWSGDGISGVYAWGAQLLNAADAAATGNAYQRIVDAATYATGGVFRPYLAFDGVDDSLATNAVDFTATDKMSVFAGANKTSDAAFGVVAELSATIATNNGSFLLSAPNSAAANYNFSAGGTARVDNVVSTYAAPITNVITGLANIAAPSNQVRINGASIATVTTTQGAGAFGNYPMYFGRRNNATNPFNGRIYGLIVRGAASSAVEVAQTESWLNAKTGAY